MGSVGHLQCAAMLLLYYFSSLDGVLVNHRVTPAIILSCFLNCFLVSTITLCTWVERGDIDLSVVITGTLACSDTYLLIF